MVSLETLVVVLDMLPARDGKNIEMVPWARASWWRNSVPRNTKTHLFHPKISLSRSICGRRCTTSITHTLRCHRQHGRRQRRAASTWDEFAPLIRFSSGLPTPRLAITMGASCPVAHQITNYQLHQQARPFVFGQHRQRLMDACLSLFHIQICSQANSRAYSSTPVSGNQPTTPSDITMHELRMYSSSLMTMAHCSFRWLRFCKHRIWD